MAQSVDTKIVELKFNNDNFADKVKSTLTQLTQLTNHLDTLGSEDVFSNLSKQVKGVDVSGINDGVKEVHNNFSKLEVVATTALANITNSAVNLGKRLVSNLVAPLKNGILQGGLARARNIEQATFSFEGQKIMMKRRDKEVGYYNEVMDAVLGTSYSYDVAAKAASQLAASNIGVVNTERKLADGSTITAKTLNSGMTDALLGIAGVAAMTGSDFDSISQIFTRVAGQSRVMANDLNSIASRGLNASATLASYINGVNSGSIEVSDAMKKAVQEVTTSTEVTEGDLREFVSDSKISFDIFSDAMSRAFGQHAKDSTLTFQGALDDVNAALARIGADFYGSALKAGRDILNSVTPLVDAFHDKIQKALDDSGSFMDKGSKSLSRYLDLLSYLIQLYPDKGRDMNEWIDDHMNAWTNIADLFKKGYLDGNIVNVITSLKSFTSELGWGENEKGIGGWKMLADYLGLTKKEVKALAKEGKIDLNTFYKAFHKLWSESPDLMAIADANEQFNNYLKNMIGATGPSELFNKQIDTFFSILNGGKSLLSSFATILGGFGRIFLSLAQHLKPLGKMLLDATEATAKFVVHIADFIATSESFSQILDGIIKVIAKIFELVNVSKLAQFALFALGKVFDFIAKAVDTVQSGIAKIIGVFADIFGKIVNRLKEIVSSTEELSALLTAIKQAGIVILLINFIGMVSKPLEMLENMSRAFTNVGKSIGKVVDSVGNVLTSIAGLVGKIGKVIDEVTNALKRLQELIIATAILEIAIAIAVLAGAFYLLSKLDINGIEGAAVAILSFGSIAVTLVKVFQNLGEISKVRKFWEKSVNDIKDVGKACLMFATSIAIMAAAVYALSKVDPKRLLAGTAAVEVLLVTMAMMAKMLSGDVVKTTGLKSLWSGVNTSKSMTKGLLGLVAMAYAVKIAADAIVKVATVDPDEMSVALAVVETLMWSMALIVKILSKEKPDKMAKGTMALLAMALAIKMLVKPMIILSEIASTNNDGLWSAVGAISALMVIMGILMKLLSGNEGMLKAGIAILMIASALKILQDVVAAFSTLDPETMIMAIAGIGMALFAMVLSLALIDENGVLAKAAALWVIAKALTVLQGVVMDFGANNEQAWAGLGVAVVALLALAAACYVFKKVPIVGILKLFLTLALGAVIVAAFGLAIGVFGVGVGVFGVGLAVLANGLKQISDVIPEFLVVMVAFGVALALLGTIGWPAIAVILALAAAFLIFGAAMVLIGTGLEHTASSIKIMTEMKNALGDTIDKITEFVKGMKKLSGDAETIGASFDKLAEPLDKIKSSIKTVSDEFQKLLSSYSELVGKTSECMTSLADSLVTISHLNSESFSAATEAVKGFIDELKGMSGDAETVATMSTSVSDSLTSMKDTFDLAKEAIRQFKKLSTKVFDELGASLNSVAEPLNVLNGLKDNLSTISANLVSFITDLSGIKEKATTAQEGATTISNSLYSLENSAQAVKDTFTGLGQGIADNLTQIGTGLDTMGKGFKTIIKIKDQLPGAATAISDFYTTLSNLGGVAESVAKDTDRVAKAVKGLGKAAKNAASLSASGMSDSGSEMVGGLIKGMGDKKSELETTVTSMVDTAAQKVRNKRQKWYDLGAYLIKGMVSGISSQQTALEKQVEELEAKAERAVKAKAQIESPSKVWAKIGAYMGMGLVKGIANSEHDVKVAALGLATVSSDAIESAIYSISDAINSNLDVSPTITPVVDLSNISAAGGYISSSFARNQAIGISRMMNGSPSALNYAADSIVNGVLSAQNQNGSIDPKLIYEAVRQGASDAEIRGITLNGRELKRGLRDMGVVTR